MKKKKIMEFVIEHLNTAYKFIKTIIENNKKELIITENKDI